MREACMREACPSPSPCDSTCMSPDVQVRKVVSLPTKSTYIITILQIGNQQVPVVPSDPSAFTKARWAHRRFVTPSPIPKQALVTETGTC